MRGGAETMYPEWRARGATLAPPAAQSTIKPAYTDASTRIAERADAQRPRPPAYDKVEALHVAGNVYLIAGAGGEHRRLGRRRRRGHGRFGRRGGEREGARCGPPGRADASAA